MLTEDASVGLRFLLVGTSPMLVLFYWEGRHLGGQGLLYVLLKEAPWTFAG